MDSWLLMSGEDAFARWKFTNAKGSGYAHRAFDQLDHLGRAGRIATAAACNLLTLLQAHHGIEQCPAAGILDVEPGAVVDQEFRDPEPVSRLVIFPDTARANR